MEGHGVNWDDLRVLDAAARASSVSIAAGMLRLSQPQVSRRLRALEDRLGVRLFDRTPQGLRPTTAGARLIPLVAEMRAAADRVEIASDDLAGEGMRTVRLSVDEVRARFLLDRWAAFARELDGVTLSLIASQTEVDHLRRETEVQIRNCLPNTDSLIARGLGRMVYAVFGSREYVTQHPAAWSDQRFAECAWVTLSTERHWYPALERWLAERLAKPPALRVNAMTLALDAVVQGAGLTLLPAFMGAADPRLVAVTGFVDALTTEEHLIVHRDLLREPAVRAVINAVAQVYRRGRSQLLGETLGPIKGATAAE